MTDELKPIKRSLEAIQKGVDLLDDDRNILEDILLKIDQGNRDTQNLREEVKLLNERVQKLEKSNTADIKEVKEILQGEGD